MKTNASAPRAVSLRLAMIGVVFAVLVVLELGLGEALALRLGHTTAIPTEGQPVPEFSISDLMAAVR